MSKSFREYVFQIPTYCTIYLLDKTHVKIRTSNPLKFFKYNTPTCFNPSGSSSGSKCSYIWSYWIFLYLLMLLVWWWHACGCIGYVVFGWSERTGNDQTNRTQHNLYNHMHAATTPITSTNIGIFSNFIYRNIYSLMMIRKNWNM